MRIIPLPYLFHRKSFEFQRERRSKKYREFAFISKNIFFFLTLSAFNIKPRMFKALIEQNIEGKVFRVYCLVIQKLKKFFQTLYRKYLGCLKLYYQILTLFSGLDEDRWMCQREILKRILQGTDFLFIKKKYINFFQCRDKFQNKKKSKSYLYTLPFVLISLP